MIVGRGKTITVKSDYGIFLKAENGSDVTVRVSDVNFAGDPSVGRLNYVELVSGSEISNQVSRRIFPAFLAVKNGNLEVRDSTFKDHLAGIVVFNGALEAEKNQFNRIILGITQFEAEEQQAEAVIRENQLKNVLMGSMFENNVENGTFNLNSNNDGMEVKRIEENTFKFDEGLTEYLSKLGMEEDPILRPALISGRDMEIKILNNTFRLPCRNGTSRRMKMGSCLIP